MTSILHRGLRDATVQEVLDVPADFVPKIVGGELVRARSQTVYYVLTRKKGLGDFAQWHVAEIQRALPESIRARATEVPVFLVGSGKAAPV